MGTLPGAAADDGAAVLIVEDEPLVQAMAADIFMDAGYRVFEACHAADAMTLLEDRDDIGGVFTDIEMPGEMNGLALAATIQGRWPAIAVLITSGRFRPHESLLPEGSEFIPKPYLPSDVVERMEAIGLSDRAA
jgi:two-component system, response regulator PdtaR